MAAFPKIIQFKIGVSFEDLNEKEQGYILKMRANGMVWMTEEEYLLLRKNAKNLRCAIHELICIDGALIFDKQEEAVIITAIADIKILSGMLEKTIKICKNLNEVRYITEKNKDNVGDK